MPLINKRLLGNIMSKHFQEIVVNHQFFLPDQVELVTYFEEQKAKVLELDKEVEKVDVEIERLVRGVVWS